MAESRAHRIIFPMAIGLGGLAFLLPALAMPNDRGLFILLGLPALAVLSLAPLILARIGLPVDRLLYSIATPLICLGLATLARIQLAQPSLGMLAQKQIIWCLAGLAALALGILFGRAHLAAGHYRYLILLGSLVFMALTIPFGDEAGGSRAWFRLGPISLQPSELIRPALLFFLASYLGQHQPLLRAGNRANRSPWRQRWLLGPVLAMWALSLAILLVQRDLGTAVLYFATFLLLLYLASGRPRYLLTGAGLGALGCLAAAFFVGHVRARFIVWLHPMALADGAGFQNARSLFAIASGGLLGTGPGMGIPQSIPAVQTDLIFAALAEELGLAGALAILLLFLALLARGLILANRSRERVGVLFGTGLAFSLGLQIFLIAGGTIGLLPLTGITMPLLSYGGSSLVSTMLCLGIMSGLARGRGGRWFAD